MTDYADARRKMVDNQLRTTDVTHREVLDAMGAVAREDFVPEASRQIAYLDREIGVGGGRKLATPSALGRLLQLADPREGQRVLIIGAGSGYAAAVLARIAGSVVALESDAELVAAARQALAGEKNVEVAHGPLAAGLAARAPYDLIIYGGSVADSPQEIFGQLAEQGRLIAVEGFGSTAVAKVYVKDGAVASSRRVFTLSLPPLTELAREPAFAF